MSKTDRQMLRQKVCQRISVTGKKLSDVLIYLSINPKYSIPLLGRFTFK